MSIFSRLRKAVSGIDNPLARVILFGLSKNAVWTPGDYYSLSKAGYENCMAVYACVSLIARSAAGIEWTATVNEKDVPKHPILKLLNHPNDDEGRRQFITKCFSFYLLSGNRYVLAGRIGSQPPLALWVPRPDRMKVLPGGKGQLVAGYEYGSPGQLPIIEPSLVMHSKLFHPTDDFYGLSPLSVAAHAVDVSNMSAEWNARLLQNDMRPPGALSTDGRLDDAQFTRLKDMMKQEWQGYENAGQPLLLEGGLKWVNFMLTAKEMDWLNTTKFNRRDIASVFNVDPCLIGDSEYATYSNKVEARRGLYEDNVIPLMDELGDDLNFWLSPMFGAGVVLGINKDKIPALQENREKVYSYIGSSDFLTVNEKRLACGYETLGKIGDIVLTSFSRIPLDQISSTVYIDPALENPDADPNANPPDEANADEGDGENTPKMALNRLTKGFWQVPERKRALWNNFVSRIEAKERGLVGMAAAYLKKQTAEIGVRARQMGNVQDLRKANLLNIKDEVKRYGKDMRAWYADSFMRAGAAGMRVSKGEIPDVELKDINLFALTDARARKLEDIIVRSGTQISENTMKIVRDLLMGAEFDNQTVEEVTQSLIKKLTDFEQFRCRRIARTETGKVENWGQVEGYRETGWVKTKIWLCSFVPDSREAHMAADSQEVALDDHFTVDGQAMDYPGDPAGDAGNVCNCLCTTGPGMND